MAGGWCEPPPPERRSAARRPRAVPESCSKPLAHRAAGWKHGARGRPRREHARGAYHSSPSISRHRSGASSRPKSWVLRSNRAPPLMRRPAWLSARSARRPTRRGGVRGSGTTRGRVRRPNPRASSAPRPAECESRFAARRETAGRLGVQRSSPHADRRVRTRTPHANCQIEDQHRL